MILLDLILKFSKPDESGNWFKTYAPLIGNIVTVILFVLAYFINKKIEKARKKKANEEKLKYFASLSVSSIRVAKKQMQNISDCVIQFENKVDFRFHILKFSPFSDVNRVTSKLNLEDYFSAYLSKYGSTDIVANRYHSTIHIFDYLDEFYKLLQDETERSSKNHYERALLLNPILREIEEKIELVMERFESYDRVKYNELRLTMQNYYLNGGDATNQIMFLKEKYFLPLSSLIEEYNSIKIWKTEDSARIQVLLTRGLSNVENVIEGILEYKAELRAKVHPLDEQIRNLEVVTEDLRRDFYKITSKQKE